MVLQVEDKELELENESRHLRRGQRGGKCKVFSSPRYRVVFERNHTHRLFMQSESGHFQCSSSYFTGKVSATSYSSRHHQLLRRVDSGLGGYFSWFHQRIIVITQEDFALIYSDRSLQ